MTPTATAYLDNVVCSGLLRGDLDPHELAAAQRLEAAAANGQLRLATSRQTYVEQDRSRDISLRARLSAHRSRIPRLPDDHLVLGFTSSTDYLGGYVVSPLVSDVVDQALLDQLKSDGLKEGDARHLMYAVHSGCNYFVTTDNDFGVSGNPKVPPDTALRQRLETHTRGLRIVTPSMLVHILGI